MQRPMEDGGLHGNGQQTRGAMDDRIEEMFALLERNMSDLVQGLSLLGAKRCSYCRKFFRSSDQRSLFHGGGEPVCLECVPAWWTSRRDQLSGADRREVEGNLAFWLRSFHKARSLKGSRKPTEVKFELDVSCLECGGTGTYMGGKRCRYCDGPGTVRVTVPEAVR